MILKRLFGLRAAPVVIDINELYRHLDLHNKRYNQDPQIHLTVLYKLNQITLRGSGNAKGAGRVHYRDPWKRFIIKGPSREFLGDLEPEETHIRSSAYIAFTEAPRAFGKRAFALVICKDSDSVEDLDNAFVFGIYGVFGKDGRMTVKTIMTPGKDEAHRMTETKAIPVTPENVQGALRYAKLCIDEITSGQKFFPRRCFEQSMRQDTAQNDVKLLPPAP